MLRDLGNAINTFLSIAPVTIGVGATATSVEGVSADRTNYESAVFVFGNYEPYGTPTGVTVTCVVQESSDDVTFTDITSEAHNITNTYTNTEVAVNLASVDKYVRGKMTVQFNGGTGPFTTVDCVGILGSARNYPV
jgi:hypothetical protein